MTILLNKNTIEIETGNKYLIKEKKKSKEIDIAIYVGENKIKEAMGQYNNNWFRISYESSLNDYLSFFSSSEKERINKKEKVEVFIRIHCVRNSYITRTILISYLNLLKLSTKVYKSCSYTDGINCFSSNDELAQKIINIKTNCWLTSPEKSVKKWLQYDDNFTFDRKNLKVKVDKRYMKLPYKNKSCDIDLSKNHIKTIRIKEWSRPNRSIINASFYCVGDYAKEFSRSLM